MKIGVTGAFGFLGANFIASLLDDRRQTHSIGDDVGITAFASRTRSNPLFDPSAVRVEGLDVLDYEDMARKFAGLDAIAHFAGRVDYSIRAKRSVWVANVLGTKRVLDAAMSAGVGRVLHVSSICVLGTRSRGETGLLAESDSPYAKNRSLTSFDSATEALDAVDRSSRGDYSFLRKVRIAYFDSKLAAWELAKACASGRGQDIVTVFPGTAVGPGDLHYAISRLIDGVWDGSLGSGLGGATSFVDSRDFARGAVLAMTKGRAGEGYVVSGRDEDNLTYGEFMSLVARVARDNGGRPRARPARAVSRAIALSAAAVVERVAPGLGLSRALVLSGTVRNVCSSAKARVELGYEPGAGLEPAILECRRFGEASRNPLRREDESNTV
jgi:dihydroflavonol-4-reductase